MLPWWQFFSAEEGKYTNLIRSVSSLPSAEIISLAEREESAGNDEKAVVLYMLVCSRNADNMTEKEREYCTFAHLRVGYIYNNTGNYTNALEFLISGLQICEAGKEKKYIARLYKDIGIIYCLFQDFEKGISYFKEGYRLVKDYPDEDTEYNLLVNLFGACMYQGNVSDARAYRSLMMKTRHTETDVSRYMDRFTGALLKSGEQRYDEAVADFKRLSVLARESGISPQYECCAYEEIYKAYLKMNIADSAFIYMTMCKDMVEKHHLQHKFTDILKDISDYYEKEGNIRMSHQYKAEYLTLKDSIFNTREFDIVKNRQFLYEVDKTNKEIQALHEEERRREMVIRFQTAMIAGALVGVIIVSVLLVFVYRQKLRLKESYRNLFVMNRRLTDSHDRAWAQHSESRDELKRKDKEIMALNDKLREMLATQTTENEPGEETETKGKYNSSNLNEETRRRLVDDISGVMENTLEYCSEDFTLEKLADLVGSNSKYVSQVINDTYGKNFSSYVNEYRIRVACRRLTDKQDYGNYTISAIGQSVGFKSNTTFTSVFRKQIGMPPSVYQKIVNEENA